TSMALEEHLLRLEGSLERDKIPVSKSEHLRLLIALHISEEALGEDHRAVAGDLRKLASFLALRGKDQLAEQLLWRARMISLLNKVAGFDYPGIERDLLQVAEWLESRNQGADRTVAFHMRKRVERLAEKRFSKSKR
ncbi:MAG TPA: hypothetical protein PKZ32_22080, partial [Candidatus Melainabacteria bacterium]|nr:hypothetical protein [Candidatus Melainabacteria bacterium]